MEAELWQGHPKEPEGWETTIYLTYGATAVLLTMALGFAPDTSIKTVISFCLSPPSYEIVFAMFPYSQKSHSNLYRNYHQSGINHRV